MRHLPAAICRRPHAFWARNLSGVDVARTIGYSAFHQCGGPAWEEKRRSPSINLTHPVGLTTPPLEKLSGRKTAVEKEAAEPIDERRYRRSKRVVTLKIRLTRPLKKIVQERSKFSKRITHFGVRTGMPLQDWMLMVLEVNEALPISRKITDLDLSRLAGAEFPHSKTVQLAVQKGSMVPFRKCYNTGIYSYGMIPRRRSYEYDSLGRAWANRRLVKPQPEVWDGRQSVEAMRAEAVELLWGEAESPERKEQWAQYCQRRAAQQAVHRSKVPKIPAGAEALRRSARASKKRRQAADRRATRKRETKRLASPIHLRRGPDGRYSGGPAERG